MESHETISLGDVLRTSKGKISDPYTSDYKFGVRGEDFDSNSLRLRRRTPIAEVGPTFVKTFRPGDILYVTRRAYLRKTAVPDFEGVCANTTLVLEHTSDKVAKALLPFIFQSEAFVQYAIDHSVGSTNPYTKWTDLKKFRFPLFSLDKQQELVQLFQGLETTIQATEAAIAKNNVILESVLNKSFSDKSKTWDMFLLKKIADVSYGISKAMDKNLTVGVKTITLPCVSKDCVLDVREDWVFTDSDLVKSDDILQKGDILFNWRNGSKDHLGKTAYFQEEGTYTHVGFLLKIRAHKEIVHPKFLWWYLKQLKRLGYFLRAKQQVNNTYNSEELNMTPILLPHISQQLKIADLLDEIEFNSKVLQNKLDSNNSLKFKILNSMVSGSAR